MGTEFSFLVFLTLFDLDFLRPWQINISLPLHLLIGLEYFDEAWHTVILHYQILKLAFKEIFACVSIFLITLSIKCEVCYDVMIFLTDTLE